MAQPTGVAMGHVGVPAQGGGPGPGVEETAVRQPLGAAAQSPANAQQAVVAQTDAPANDMRPNETGAAGGAVEVGFLRVHVQPQASKVFPQNGQGLPQRLGVIGEQGQVIHVAQAGLDAG